MNKQELRQQILGVLVEESHELVGIARKAEKEVLEAVKRITDDDDDKKKAAKMMGLTMASLEFEDMLD